MSQQPQGPGWWQASDGRWYPPQPPAHQPPPYQPYPPQPYAPAPRSSRRGCWIAAIVVLAVVLLGVVAVGYFLYAAANRVAEVAGGVTGDLTAECPTEQDVSGLVGSPVKLAANLSVVVASGCTYVALDRAAGTDVQITTGVALIADEEIKSFTAEAAREGGKPGSIPVGERGLAYGAPHRSGAIAVSGNKLVEVEVFSAGKAIGDKEAAAVTLLKRMITS